MPRYSSLWTSTRIIRLFSGKKRACFGNRGMGVVNQGEGQLTVQADGYAFRIGREQGFPDELVEQGGQLLLLLFVQ